MSRLPLLLLLLVGSVGAQEVTPFFPCPSPSQLPCEADKQKLEQDAGDLATAWSYSYGLEKSLADHTPLLFAAEGKAPRNIRWRRYRPEEWIQAGKPRPAALVWEQAGNVVAVKMALPGAANETKRVDYYFWGNGNLARMHVESRLAGSGLVTDLRPVVLGWERLGSEDGKQQLSTSNNRGFPMWSEDFQSLRPVAPEFRTIWELSFTLDWRAGTVYHK